MLPSIQAQVAQVEGRGPCQTHLLLAAGTDATALLPSLPPLLGRTCWTLISPGRPRQSPTSSCWHWGTAGLSCHLLVGMAWRGQGRVGLRVRCAALMLSLLPCAPCRMLLVLGGAASLAMGLFAFVVRADACMRIACWCNTRANQQAAPHHSQHGPLVRPCAGGPAAAAAVAPLAGSGATGPLLPGAPCAGCASWEVGRGAALCCWTQGAETRERTHGVCHTPTAFRSYTWLLKRVQSSPPLLACGASAGSGTSGLRGDVPLPLPFAPPNSCWCR